MPATLTLSRPPAPPAERLYTAHDLLTHPEWGPCELVRGKVVPVCRPKNKHGRLVVSLGGKLDVFVETNGLGMVFSESGVFTEHDPDTVRSPDIHFVRTENCPTGEAFDGYMEKPPELCVEIVSPSDTPAKLWEKITEYRQFKVKLIWVIDPELLQARVYRLDGTWAEIPYSGVLSGEDVLPGFELPLAKLFAVILR